MKKKTASRVKSLLFVALSMICISGPISGFYFMYQYLQKQRRKDSSYVIEAILQTSPSSRRLSTQYLAECLDLSLEASQNLFQFDKKLGEKQLENSPFIRKATIKKMKPNTLYIDYERHKPIAKLCDIPGYLIDSQGYVFFNLFQEELPEIYLGLSELPGKEKIPISSPKFTFSLEVLKNVKRHFPKELKIKRIDVSKAFDPSFGKRELVLLLEEERRLSSKQQKVFFPKYLRVNVKNYIRQLSNFLVLNESMWKDYEKQLSYQKTEEKNLHFHPKTFDLRIKDLAFVDQGE